LYKIKIMVLDYVEKIMASPDAPQQLNALYAALQDEKKRRHDFREWITPAFKAEFINGEVIVHSPVKKRHFSVTDLLSSLLSFYVRVKKLGRVATEKAMIALTRNDYEPDLVFFSKEKFDSFTDDQVLFPAPDFIVEILSKSTASVDRGIKKQDYAAHGVQEYWIIDPIRQRIEQYILFEGSDTYAPAKYFGLADDIESHAIKGFIIPVQAIFDETVNVETIQDLLNA
jgi:Uma2 family endonuclease